MQDGASNVGADAVVSALEVCGVERVFGIPGTHNLEIYRSLSRSSIRHVVFRHEQGAGYAADGHSRASGRPGVVLTTTGPGLMNATTALATAYADSVPVLALSPGVPIGLEGADVGFLHEPKDQQGCMDRLVERSVRVRDADEAADAICETFARWSSGRPRPVHIEIPLDVLEGVWGAAAQPAARTLAPPSPGPEQLARALEAMSTASRPLIVAGGGCRAASGALRELAERWDAAVVTTVNGKGALSERHELSAGAHLRLASVRRALDDADCLLVVGSELADSDLWGGTLCPGGPVVRIDIDDAQLRKNLPERCEVISLHGDARAVMEALSARLAATAGVRRSVADGASQAAEIRDLALAEATEQDGLWRAINDAVRAELPRTAIVAGDSAQVSYYGTAHFWPADEPGQFLYPTGYATLGYGLPAAIGAKLAAPERPVVVLVGDGGFMFTASELLTAAELGLSLPIVVANNRGFGEIRDQMRERGIPPIGVDLLPPDFALLAQACGGSGRRVSDVNRLGAAVSEALTVPGPTVIELEVGS
ncbi:MAG TPA: 5-guanidino-2-oxopentanoate decarboxylase [Conexibacter sp.]|nr:5-guanidino-2-oxopentanoate decarboxylase [Conexibacter sp.]